MATAKAVGRDDEAPVGEVHLAACETLQRIPGVHPRNHRLAFTPRVAAAAATPPPPPFPTLLAMAQADRAALSARFGVAVGKRIHAFLHTTVTQRPRDESQP